MSPAKKSVRSKSVLVFKDGRKSAKVGDVVVLKNGAHAEIYQRTDSEGNKYAAMKFVSAPSKLKKSASSKKKSPSASAMKKSTKHKHSVKLSPRLELKPKSAHNLTRNDFCF